MAKTGSRQVKTPRERAEAALGVAQRRVSKLEKALTHQRGLVATYETDLAEARRRMEYAAANPDLPADVPVDDEPADGEQAVADAAADATADAPRTAAQAPTWP